MQTEEKQQQTKSDKLCQLYQVHIPLMLVHLSEQNIKLPVHPALCAFSFPSNISSRRPGAHEVKWKTAQKKKRKKR